MLPRLQSLANFDTMKPLILAFTLALAAPLYAQNAPANWTSQTRKNGARTFVPPDLKTGEIHSVTVYAAAPLDGTLAAWLLRFAGPVGVNAGQLATALRIASTDAVIASASGEYNAPAGGKLGVIFSAFSFDGESVVATRTLFSKADLLARYQKQSGALTQEIIQIVARENARSLWDKARALERVASPLGVYEGWQIQYGNDYITADQARAKLRLELYAGGEYRLTKIGGGADYRSGGGGSYSYEVNGGLNFDTALTAGLGTAGHYANDEDQFCIVGRDANGAPVIYAANQYPSRETILRYVGPTDAATSPASLRAKAKLDDLDALEAAKYKWVTAPGKGVQPAQIAAIINRHDVQIRAGGLAGMVSDITDEVYLLLKDGTARRGLPVAPDDLDIARSRANEPKNWGRWRATKNPNQWQISIGGGAFQTVEADKAAPAPAQLKLGATYTAYSSSSDVFGGSYGQTDLTFTSTGRFVRSSRGGSYGSLGASVGGANTSTTYDDENSTLSAQSGNGLGIEARERKNNPRGDREGNYALSGYTLTLRYDDGRVERLPFLRFFGGSSVWFEGQRMTR